MIQVWLILIMMQQKLLFTIGLLFWITLSAFSKDKPKYFTQGDFSESEMASLSMQDYVEAFSLFSEIEKASDSIAKKEVGEKGQVNAEIWKMSVIKEVKNGLLQPNRQIALLDAWLLAATMTDFFKVGTGKNLFGNSQEIAIAAAERLLLRLEALGQKEFRRNYLDAQFFVNYFRKTAPCQSLSFRRKSVEEDWYKYLDDPTIFSLNTDGSFTGLLSDYSSRIMKGGEEKLEQMMSGFGNNVTSLYDATTKELGAMRDSLGVSRKAIMTNVDDMYDKVVVQVKEEVGTVIRGLLVYIILFLVLMLFLPFGLGFWAGTAYRKKRTKPPE